MTQQQQPRIGIVIGSTREGRFGEKPAHFVGYGGAGAARAVEQLRLIAIALQMAPVAHAVHVGMVESLGMMQQGKTLRLSALGAGGRRDVLVGKLAEAGTRRYDDRRRRPRAKRENRHRHGVN
jgi:hypothetical protein